MKFTILVVDDEKNIRDGLASNFEMDGYKVKTAENGNVALEILSKNEIDLVITDLRMPGKITGEELLRRVATETPLIPVIVLTGHGSVDSAVDAMRSGAYDFLTKPLNLDHLSLVVKRALENREVKLQKDELQKKVDDSSNQKNAFKKIIGTSVAMQKVLSLVQKVAPTNSTVLITGETGVGKEGIAEALHMLSTRAKKPLIKVNCAALSENLLESELFGYEKGAFTGAEKTHKGRFELAHEGTIFLDEIGEINQNTQIKLLRVLQERQFERVGGEETIEIDVRIIAATNKNLEKEVSAGKFRSDLFYRLNVIKIEVPPLRERKDDIALLTNEFLTEYNAQNKTKIRTFDAKSKKILSEYSWPGNIRELQNCVTHAAVMASSEIICAEDLPPSVLNSCEQKTISIPIGMTLKNAEKMIFQKTLDFQNGNKSKAAEILGISRKTLHRKLSEWNL